MDIAPHTHSPLLQQAYPALDAGFWRIRYGDTEVLVRIFGIFPVSRTRELKKNRVERAIRKAVRKHDFGTAKMRKPASFDRGWMDTVAKEQYAKGPLSVEYPPPQ